MVWRKFRRPFQLAASHADVTGHGPTHVVLHPQAGQESHVKGRGCSYSARGERTTYRKRPLGSCGHVLFKSFKGIIYWLPIHFDLIFSSHNVCFSPENSQSRRRLCASRTASRRNRSVLETQLLNALPKRLPHLETMNQVFPPATLTDEYLLFLSSDSLTVWMKVRGSRVCHAENMPTGILF